MFDNTSINPESGLLRKKNVKKNPYFIIHRKIEGNIFWLQLHYNLPLIFCTQASLIYWQKSMKINQHLLGHIIYLCIDKKTRR